MVKQTSEFINLVMLNRVLNVLVLQESKRRLQMTELAAKALLYFGIYVPLYIYSLVITFADVRFWVLTAFIVITGSWRFTRWLRRDDRMNELKEEEVKAKQIANRMQELDMRERELELMEREAKVK